MLARDDIPGGRFEDLGVALRGDAELGPGPDLDAQVDLVAADEPAAVGEEEDEDAELVGGGGGGDELQRVLEGDGGEGGYGGGLELYDEMALAGGGEGGGEGGGHIGFLNDWYSFDIVE